MARNGSGTFSVVNTFVAGNSITASGHNQNFTDVGAEITNSVAADGQTAMTGPLKAANGTVGAPALTLASQPTWGFYKTSTGIGISIGATRVAEFTPSGLTYGAFPSGTGMFFYNAAAPTGWTATGANDYALRIVAGGGVGGTLGGATGFSTVFGQTTTGSHTILVSEMPTHAHGGATGTERQSHDHGFTAVLAGAAGNGAGVGGGQLISAASSGGTTASENQAHDHAITAEGGSAGHTHTMSMNILYANVILATKD